ncbi:PE-PGRS family protein [Amycolatopsis sp., V23-08]|uniref:PE-PGRS family protein n=1 Tax=Amycolatopsis heterodermiae TaxID=3110235 RepID=A0ABU5R1T1_9PSEU|nr:PE-PGRS family protein [Amycolatopsis sp., V23-08]MEA5359789.1 PE-PGRS family protein [Amycolatopsis sp., V23-08]
MQTWAKRGLQTALVTGGLLMLGTGIASADENVNPDSPASPLDLNVTAPISEANNAVGTPFGQLDLPAGQTELSTKPATKAANEAVKQLDEASPISQSTLGGATKADGAGAFTPGHNNLKGNKVAGDVVVPIQIVDNAIGVIGDAHVDGTDHSQTWSHNQDVATDGSKSGLAGNAVVLDWALPVQIAGNSGGVAGGSGAVHGGSASQSTSETGNIDTDGTGSGLSGNVVAGQFATPVQVTGNAVSYLLGNAYSQYDADSDATSGGSIKSAGDGGSGSGNIVGVPIALPVKFNGNAGGVWGSDADTLSNSSADAKAGDTRDGSLGIPTYEETSGNDSFLDGNAAAVSLSPIANVAGVAASWIGNAATGGATGRDGEETQGGSSSSTVDSGGFVKTAGDGSGAGGNVINPSVALPVEAFGIGGTYIGNSHANHDNTTDANAGNGSYTKGNDAVLGGNIVNTQTAGAPEVYGIGASHIGNATGTSTEDKTVTAGAYDGSQGDDSSGSGNVVQVPVAVPAEVFGVGGSFIGQGSGSAEETKVVSGGGGGSTKDDNGFLSSNLGTVPASLPVQVANIGGAFIGQGHGKGSTDTTSNAGGDVKANGPAGAGAGNIVEAPVSLPVLAAGSGAALGGIGTGENDNITDSSAGGDALTDGQDGAIAGNIVKAPVAGAAQLFSDGVAGAALGHGLGSSDTVSSAGGDATTNGDRGAIAGDIVGVDALPVAQIFGDAVSAGGVSSGNGQNTTTVTNAGDDTTSGVEGALAGDILDIPATAIAQFFGDAVAVGGVAHANGDNVLTTENGGEPVTEGDGSSLSGYNFYHELVAPVQIFGVPLELLGNATADYTDMTSIDGDTVDSADPISNPVEGSELGAGELPSLTGLASGLPTAGLPTQGLPALPTAIPTQRADVPVSGPMSGMPHLPTPGLPTAGGLPGLSSLSALGGALPGHGTERADLPTTGGLPVHVPALSGGLLPTLPAVPALGGGVPTLPVALPVTPALPANPQLPAAPTTLPAAPAALPVNAKLPVLDSAAPAAQVPAMSGLDSTGFLAKLLGLVKRK